MTLKQGKYDVVPTDLMSPTCSISYASSNTAWRKQRSLCLSAVPPFSCVHIWVSCLSCLSSTSLNILNIIRICTIKRETLELQCSLAPKLKQPGAGGTGKMLGPTYCVVLCRRKTQQRSAFQQATFIHLLTVFCSMKQS